MILFLERNKSCFSGVFRWEQGRFSQKPTEYSHSHSLSPKHITSWCLLITRSKLGFPWLVNQSPLCETEDGTVSAKENAHGEKNGWLSQIRTLLGQKKQGEWTEVSYGKGSRASMTWIHRSCPCAFTVENTNKKCCERQEEHSKEEVLRQSLPPILRSSYRQPCRNP